MHNDINMVLLHTYEPKINIFLLILLLNTFYQLLSVPDTLFMLLSGNFSRNVLTMTNWTLILHIVSITIHVTNVVSTFKSF